MNTAESEKFFKNFPKEKVDGYMEYWEAIKPKNHEDIFKRYLFAFCSVHTSFQGNIRGYQSIEDFNSWFEDKELLREKLKSSGCGLHNNRTEYIWNFKNIFWIKPKDFYFTTNRLHLTKRDQITSTINGLGLAKVSFALEMCHPNSARVLCGDIHQLRLYGLEKLKYNNPAGISSYKKMESHWIINCGKIKVPPYIARSIYWDKIQNKENTKYWSFVFEK